MKTTAMVQKLTAKSCLWLVHVLSAAALWSTKADAQSAETADLQSASERIEFVSIQYIVDKIFDNNKE